jgi:hypothetical protein
LGPGLVADRATHGIIDSVKRLPIVVAVGAVSLVVVVGIGWGATPGPGASPAASSANVSPVASRSSGPAGSPAHSTPSASLPPVDSPLADVPIVPVAQYRTTAERVSRAQIQAAFDGIGATWDGLELVESEAPAILAGLGLTGPGGIDRLFLAPDATTVMTDLATNRKRLAVFRADAVGPGVRALG